MTTTREAALEAALKLARNRLQACAIDHPTGSREMAERSEWADEATAALSTPATEPQGYVEGLDSRTWWMLFILSKSGGQANASDERWDWINAFCADRGNGDDTFNLASDVGLISVSHNTDTDQSTAYLTDAGKAALAARPAPQPAADPRCCNGLSPADCATTPSRHCDGMISAQPAADTRVVTVAQLKRWASHLTQTNGRNFQYAEIRTIIEGQMQ